MSFFQNTFRNTYRRLTANEIQFAQTVFKNSIDYSKVWVHHGRLIPFFQYEKVAMSPFGTMHFPKTLYAIDFTKENISKQHLFIHEMAHIWQYHLGLKLWLDGGILGIKGGYRGNVCYRYDAWLPEKTKLNQFNMEQQADIIADYFVFQKRDERTERILQDFIANPNNVALLPTHTEFIIPKA